MDLEFAIVHDLKKEVGQDTIVRLRPAILEHSENLTSLFNNLHSLYGRKSTKGLGKFDDNVEIYRFSTLLDSFITSGSDESFLQFTHASMHIIKDRIERESLATGGYVLYISYIENGNRYLFIMVLRQTKGCVVTEELNIDEAKHLEIDKLHTGCQIDISTWKNSPDNQYITFIKGRSTTTTPQYFLKAIGCNEYANSARQTLELIKAVNDYADQEGCSYQDKQNLRQKVYEYCSATQSVLLDSLSARISDSEPEKFLDFINNGDYRIGNGFEPHHGHLRKLKEIRACGEGIHLKFPAAMLGTRIQFDDQENKVIINNPPENMAKTLREES